MADEKRKKRTRKTSDGRDRANLIHAIAHPLRRRILRVFADWGEPSSPERVAKELELPVGMVGYHVRVLLELGAVEPTNEMARGAVEDLYALTIKDDPPIETLLEETREVDEEDE